MIYIYNKTQRLKHRKKEYVNKNSIIINYMRHCIYQIPANTQPVIAGKTLLIYITWFIMLSTWCIDQVSIKTTTEDTNGPQKILFFDDQTSSFDKINELSPDATCDEIEALARPICAGDQHVTGYQVPKGTDKTYTIDISETFARRWYFVLSNCNDKKIAPVDMASFRITSPASISCGQLQEEDSTAGYIVAIVFLSLIIIVLTGVSYYMYKRSDVPAPLSNDRVGYNTL